MRVHTIIRGPILNPRAPARVIFIPDGALAADTNGQIVFVGEWAELAAQFGADPPRVRRSDGIILPPFLDAHIHIPQHPIRGRFMEGLHGIPSEGRLQWGLNHNVFPAEARCGDEVHTRRVVADFLQDTLAKGVAGGSAYMTVHPSAARIALEMLPATWSVGLVLMNQNCPEYLRTNEASLEHDIKALAKSFESRLIVTDRFAVAVNSALRKKACSLATRFDLRMQTHLNEQIVEKQFVERTLYPDAGSYTRVYLRDGLLDRNPILAHCVRMSDEEFDLIAGRQSCIAHCPVSNTLLGSGIMKLDRVVDRGIPFALCTDVGASPTTSLLTEMAQFLKVHAGRSRNGTPQQALYAATRAPAELLGLASQLGAFDIGKPLSFIEVDVAYAAFADADDAILGGLLNAESWMAPDRRIDPLGDAFRALEVSGLEVSDALSALTADTLQTAAHLSDRVRRVTLGGQVAWERV